MKRKLKTLSSFMKNCKSWTRKKCHMGDNSNHAQLHVSVLAGRGTLESNKIDGGLHECWISCTICSEKSQNRSHFLPSLAEISPTNAKNDAQQMRVYITLQANAQ